MSLEEYLNSIKGMDEDLRVSPRHAIYPTIDPKLHYTNQTFAGKVVLITGASRGIGRETSLHYARAGAAVVLVGREQQTLNTTKDLVLKEVPDAKVLVKAVDVKDWKAAEEAVGDAVKAFGKLDVVVVNAGAMTPLGVGIKDKNPVSWWNTFEVNIFGVFNFVRPAIPHLEKTSGYIVAVGSAAAQLRMSNNSDYGVSKHALNRLVEYIALGQKSLFLHDFENPNIKAFTLHPGVIATQMAEEAGAVEAFLMPDSVDLPAATMLYLTSGKADWLNGRYVSASWDLGEVEQVWKEKILEKDALVNKLYIP
ncbi:NAD-P-binding protein [Amylostereum chailletii]|nr:NAD-P-binding protein [Amylostereum chailletii]